MSRLVLSYGANIKKLSGHRISSFAMGEIFMKFKNGFHIYDLRIHRCLKINAVKSSTIAVGSWQGI